MPLYANVANQPTLGKTLTIETVEYRAIRFSLSKPTREIRRNDNQGDRAEYEIHPEPITGTASLQLATTSTAEPARGATFTEDTVLYVITDVSPASPQGEHATVDISFTAADAP